MAATERQTFHLLQCACDLLAVWKKETYCCVYGKEVLVFNDFDREVTVTGWYPEGETKSLQIVSAALGYTIPETGNTVLLIVHHSILSPTLNHNLLSKIQMRLHDVVVNETPSFQCFKPTNLSHSISVRGDNMDKVLVIPVDLHVVHPKKNLKHTKLQNMTPLPGCTVGVVRGYEWDMVCFGSDG
jgi:hypothetical protein